MSFFKEAQSRLQTVEYNKSASANEVMRHGGNGQNGQLGFSGTSNQNELFYRQYKQWVQICIEAITSRLINLNWIAGEFEDANPNPERRGQFGVKSPGKPSFKLAKEILLKKGMQSSV